MILFLCCCFLFSIVAVFLMVLVRCVLLILIVILSSVMILAPVYATPLQLSFLFFFARLSNSLTVNLLKAFLMGNFSFYPHKNSEDA